MAKSNEVVTKFVVEFTDENGKLESRWHYDYDKFKRGPIEVEQFNIPRKEKRKKKTKKA